MEVLEDITCNYITCASSASIGNTVYCDNYEGDPITFNIFNPTIGFYPNICVINLDETKINNSLNVSGIIKLNNITTINSSLNVSGTTTLNHNTSVNSSLYVSGITILNHATTLNGGSSLKSNTAPKH